MLSPFNSEVFSEGNNRSFARIVSDCIHILWICTTKPCHRSDIDNFPFLLFDHHFANFLTHQKCTVNIYIHHLLPRFKWHIYNRSSPRSSTIIYQNIYRSKMRFCFFYRSEEHTSELQSRGHLVCRLLLEKKKVKRNNI